MNTSDTTIQPINPQDIKKAKSTLSNDALVEIVVDCFKALADTTRAKILYVLLEQKMCVRDLAITIGVSESAISHQLSFLKDKKLVKAERDGNVIYYSILYLHIEKIMHESEHYADHIRENAIVHSDEK